MRPRLGLVLCLIILGVYLSGSMPVAPAHASSTAPMATSVRSAGSLLESSQSLGAAAASLAQGAGPAAGARLACSSSSTGSMRCAPSAAPGAPPGNQNWVNLTPLSISAPPIRDSYSMAFDAADGYVVLFGGFGPNNQYGDTWTFADGIWTYHNLTGPSPREFAAMAYDVKDKEVVLFGGDCCGGYQGSNDVSFKDTWTFAHLQWTKLTPVPSPGNRTAAVMAWDGKDNYIVLFGGLNTATYNDLGDTWAFSGGAWTKMTPTIVNSTKPPKVRERASMTWDPADNEVLLYGGYSTAAFNTLNDTWGYQNDNWTKINTTRTPGLMDDAAMTYDAPLGHVVLVPGDTLYLGGTLPGGLWEFSANNWVSLYFSPAPVKRTETQMVWDGADQYALLFGGNENLGGLRLSDSWALGPNFTSSLQAKNASIDIQNSMDFVTTIAVNASAVTSATYAYTSLPPGCTTASLASLPCTPTKLGVYHVFVNVTDNWGVVVESNTTLVVNPLPIVVSAVTTPSVISLHEPFNLTFTATGGTGVLSYSYSGFPQGCSNHNLSSWTCTPNPPQGSLPLTYTINATVIDSVGGKNKTTAKITINNDPSVSLAASPKAIDFGQFTNLTATAAGGTGPLTYNYTTLPSGCSPANISVLPCQPNVVGTFTIHVAVYDSTAYTVLHPGTSSTTLTVNPYPTIEWFNVTPGSVDAGQQVQFNVVATGGTGGLNYTYTNLPGGCTSGGLFFFVCNPNQAGTYPITVTATDAIGVNVTKSATLTVVADPAITSFSASPTQVDLSQTVTLTAVTTGGMSYLVYSYTGLPKGCPSVNLTTVSCPTTSATPIGPYTVHLLIKDATGRTATQTTRLILNAPPHIRSFSVYPSPITVGQPTSFAVDATGGTGTSNYSYAGLPTGCDNNNTATLTCTPTESGSFAVMVTVTDAVGYSVSSGTNLTVNKSTACTSCGGHTTTSSGLSTLDYALIALAVAVVIALVVAAAIVSRRRGGGEPGSDEEYPEGEEGTGAEGETDGGYPVAPSDDMAPEYQEDPGEPPA